jgi:hypothetical protein
MAGLSDVLRNGVKTIYGVTKTAQTKITLHRWQGQGYDGAPNYAAPLTLTAIVEYKQEARQSNTGQLRTSRAYIIILSPLSALGAAERSEPIDERDLITLPNMTTGPIIETYGVIDAKTQLPYCHEIWMGDRRGDN